MIQYRIFVQNMYDRFCGFYETYGIALFVDGEAQRIIRDVSTDREKAQLLVNLLNEEQLEPEHFSQVVEEFLTDFDVPKS